MHDTPVQPARPLLYPTFLHSIGIFAFAAASAGPTPLYPLYQERLGLSAGLLTVIFAVYAAGLLVSLFTVGSISDFIGRRPAILGSYILQLVAMGLFLVADDYAMLIAARLIQGFATGAGNSALGAAVTDANRAQGPLLNAIAPLLGMGVGAAFSSSLVAYAPAPTRLVFACLAAIVLVQIVLLFTTPETAARRRGALAALRPQLFLPKQARRAFLLVSPANIACWSLGSFFLSLLPSLLRTASGSTSPLVGGLAVLALTVPGTIAILFMRLRPPIQILQTSNVALLIGLATILVAVQSNHPAFLVVGTIVAGLGHGTAFLGSLRCLLPLALPQERAGLLAALFVESYLAFSLPAMGAGFLSQKIGLVATTEIFLLAVFVLIVGALVATHLFLRKTPLGAAGA